MLADILLISIALLYLTFATICDLKSKEIPDWLNFSLLAVALGIRLLYSLISTQWMYFVWGVIGAAVMLGVGGLLYWGRQWGGGDTKLGMALGAVFATTPYYVSNDLPFLLILVMNIFIVGAVYGLIWAKVMALKNFSKVWKQFVKNVKKNGEIKFIIILISIIGIFLVYFLISDFLFKLLVIILLTFIIIWLYLVAYIKAVEAVAMFKWIPPKKLTEGDWIAKEVKINGKTIVTPKTLGITQKQINQLIKAKVKKVLIKDGIAFMPSFLIGTILTLIFGDILFFIFF